MSLKFFKLSGLWAPFLAFGVLVAFSPACKKTSSPFGVKAPMGFDFPTQTPTPQTGSIEVYVSDLNVPGTAVQGVSVLLVDPSGNTVGSNTTQVGFGFAPFNPPNLISGIWTADVPDQSVSYVTTNNGSPITIQRTYGNSVLPITVTGSGQFSAKFIADRNSVQFSPVTQGYGPGAPQNIPITVSYIENGTLDVPVSVSMSISPNTPGINSLSPANWVFDASNPSAADTIQMSDCYYNPITLTVTTNDFSGNPLSPTSSIIGRGFTVPVTISVDKTHISGVEYEQAMITSANNCPATIWSTGVTLNGVVTNSGTLASGQVINVPNSNGGNYTFSVSTTSPYGTISGSEVAANIQWDTWTVLATGNF